MWVKDKDTMKHAPTSKFISRKEFSEIYPETEHAKRLNFIFKYNIPLQISGQEGTILTSKYNSVVECNEWSEEITEIEIESEELKTMAWNELKSYAVKECGIPFKKTTVKRSELEALIINQKYKN